MKAKSIKGITIEIGGDTSGLEKSLKDVDKTTKDLQSELKGVNSLLKLDPKNVDLLKQKEVLLNKSIDETKKKLETLKNAQQQMKAKGVDENSEAYRDLQREIVATEKKLESFKNEAKKLDSIKLTQLGNQFKGVGDKMKNAGKAMSTYVTAPIVAAAGAAAKLTIDFDAEMSKVQAISGSTADEFGVLRDKAREMGRETKFSATEAAEGFEYMAMAGWKTDDMLKGIEPTLKLAAAAGEDLGTTSDIVTDGLTAFGLSAEDAAHFADVLAAASSNANTNVSMMGESFKYAAPVAGSMGYSVDDVAVALGLMANAGIKASSAGTSLRTLFTNMAKPTDAMASAMEQLGVSLDDGQGNMKSFREVMDDLRAGFGQLKIPAEDFEKQMAQLDQAYEDGEISEKAYNQQQEALMKSAYGAEGALKAEAAATLAGKTGMSGLMAIVNASDADYEKLTGAIENCTGATDQMYDVMMDNTAGALYEMKSAISDVGIAVGDVLTPYIREAAEWISGMANKFSELSPTAQKIIVAIGLIVAAIGPLLVVLGTMAFGIGQIMTVAPMIVGFLTGLPALVGTVAGVVGAAASTIGTALAGLWALMLANPITLIIAAIAALVAAFIILWKKCDAFRNFWIGLWNKLKTTVTAWATFIKQTLQQLPGKMMEIGRNIVTGLWNGIKSAGGWLKEKISGFVDGIVGSFKSFFGIGSPSKEMADQIGKWIPAGMSEGIKANLGGLQGAVDTMGGVVMDSPALSFAGMTDEISNAIGTGLAVQNSGGGMPGMINVVVELGGTKVGEKIVNLYDYTKKAMG